MEGLNREMILITIAFLDTYTHKVWVKPQAKTLFKKFRAGLDESYHKKKTINKETYDSCVGLFDSKEKELRHIDDLLNPLKN